MFRSPPVDLIVVLVIVLLILGPKKLPQMGRGLGQGMREPDAQEAVRLGVARRKRF